MTENNYRIPISPYSKRHIGIYFKDILHVYALHLYEYQFRLDYSTQLLFRSSNKDV